MRTTRERQRVESRPTQFRAGRSVVPIGEPLTPRVESSAMSVQALTSRRYSVPSGTLPHALHAYPLACVPGDGNSRVAR